MNKIRFTTYFICLLLISGLFVELQCTDKVTDKQKITSNLSPILIYDEDDLLEISIEDVGKYHGDVCLCLTVAFRALQLAISELWKDEIPRRGEFKIISALPTPGSKDCFEFITRVITRGKGNDFKLELPQGTDKRNITRNNFAFTFIRKSSEDSIKIQVREEIFPKGFFELRKKVKFSEKATQQEREGFISTKQEIKHRIMTLPAKEIFIFE